MKIYIVRHAESTGNLPKELRTGGIDPHLTELGQKQADLLGKRMAGRKFDYIVSFPMTRTLQTTGRHRQIYGYSSGASLDRSGGAGCGGFSGDFSGRSKKIYPNVASLYDGAAAFPPVRKTAGCMPFARTEWSLILNRTFRRTQRFFWSAIFPTFAI